MNDKELTKKSKFLSLVLRHKPEEIGLELDNHGWASLGSLYPFISPNDIDEVVAKNNKKRFEYNENKTKIRACQGHSIDVDLDLKEIAPPAFLFHGTQTDSLNSIKTDGLKKMKRNHVHLSADKETAKIVAKRRKGSYAILTIASDFMYANGFKFYKSANGVWLTDNVPYKYIRLIEVLNWSENNV
jgi:putative RNA 2'-phosphotransferase